MKSPYNITTKWDLSPLLEKENLQKETELKKEYEDSANAFINKWEKRNDYLEKPSVLKQALDDYEKLSAKYEDGGVLGYYYALETMLDQNNPELKARSNKMSELVVRVENDLQFFTHRISKIPEKKQKIFLESKELLDYRHFLEILFLQSKYLLSEAEEKILNLTGQTSYSNWVKMTADFLSKEEAEILDEKGKPVKKSFSEIWNDINNKNKTVRDSAVVEFNRIIKDKSDTAEVEINSIFQTKKVSDELRKMERPDTARHLSDDIDTATVDALIEAVESRFDLSKKYYALKAKLMGVKKLEYHERTVEYGKITKKFSYEEAVDLVGTVFKNLDSEFYYIFKDMVENGKIDVYPKKGKENTEMCISLLKEKPTYILMNYAGKLNDVVTLAHEMGHAINDELIKKHQNSLNLFTPVSTAEVASTFMQDFVLDLVAGKASDEDRLTLTMARLDDAVSAIMRQAACYRFEQELHKVFREKGYVSKAEIGGIFQKNMKAYMGNYVLQSKGSENWWIPWSHIRSYFYVYSYASGYLISKFLQGKVKEDPMFIGKVKLFLSAGASESPKSIFMGLGVDISKKEIWQRGLTEIEELLKEANVLAKRLKKI